MSGGQLYDQNHQSGRRQRRRSRRNSAKMWRRGALIAACGAAAATLVIGYALRAPGSERAAQTAGVTGVSQIVQYDGPRHGATEGQVGGWGRGGYPMVTSANAQNAAAMTSVNWAGYAAAGTPGEFTSVSTSWTQPTVTCGATDTFSSFWAGLDGDGTNTVEQTGTEADCANGTATYQGWWEMFPNAPVFYANPVHPGDAMSASVVANGNGMFTLTLSDATGDWTQTTQQTSATAQLGSAEIIAEAPSNGTVLPLSNFGTVTFNNDMINNAALGNANTSALTMVSAAGVTEATPSALTGGNSFTVTWDSSGTAAAANGTAGTAPAGTPANGTPANGSATSQSGDHW